MANVELELLNLLKCLRVAAVFGAGDRSKLKNLLVFDFGGGTLDVTIMEIESGTMNFKARPLPIKHCLTIAAWRFAEAAPMLGDPLDGSVLGRIAVVVIVSRRRPAVDNGVPTKAVCAWKV